MNDDTQLRELFGRARNREAAGVPNFETLLARRRGPGLAAPCAALALLAVAAFTTFFVSAPPPPAVSITEWRSPTAFLLRTTDEALWRGLPSLGPTYQEEFP